MELDKNPTDAGAGAGHRGRKFKGPDDFVNNNKRTRSNTTTNGSSSGIFFTTKSCASCGHPLGLFLSRGYVCHRCGFKVCKKCKIYEHNSSSWNCAKCTRNLWKKGPYPYSTSTLPAPAPATEIRDDSRVKRSWSISGPATTKTKTKTGSSPVLKSYVQIKFEDEKQFHSLPRMPTTQLHGSRRVREPEKENQAQTTKRTSNSTAWLGVDREYERERESTAATTVHKDDSHDHDDLAYRYHPSNTKTIHSFQSTTTLHPFTVTQIRKSSPSSSINFIEDEFWDYYDYRMAQAHTQTHQLQTQAQHSSNRSSCERERSLDETIIEQQQHFLCFEPPPAVPPPEKPERKTKRAAKSLSMSSYDARAKYSQLKTYCLVQRKRDHQKDVKDDGQFGVSVVSVNSNNADADAVADAEKENHSHNNAKANASNANAVAVTNGKLTPTPTPTPRTKRRRQAQALALRENVVWRDSKGNPVLGGTLPKNYKQTITIGSTSTGNNETIDTWPRKSVTKAQTPNFDDERSILMSLPYGNTSCSCETAWDTKSDDALLHHGGPCRHGYRSLNLPHQATLKTKSAMNPDPLSEFKVTVENKVPSTITSASTGTVKSATSVTTGEPKDAGEIWQQKLRQLKQDYNTINKSQNPHQSQRQLINRVDTKHNGTGNGSRREVVIPITSEREPERDNKTSLVKQQRQRRTESEIEDNRGSNKDPSKSININCDSAPVSAPDANSHPQPHVHLDADTIAILQTVSNIETICANANQMASKPCVPSISITNEDADLDPNDTDTDAFQDCNTWTTTSDDSSDDESIAIQKSVRHRSYNKRNLPQDGFKSCEEDLEDADNDHSAFVIVTASAAGAKVAAAATTAAKGVEEIPPLITAHEATSGDYTVLLPLNTATATEPEPEPTIRTTCFNTGAGVSSTSTTTAAAVDSDDHDGLVDHCAVDSSQGVVVRLNNQRPNNVNVNANTSDVDLDVVDCNCIVIDEIPNDDDRNLDQDKNGARPSPSTSDCSDFDGGASASASGMSNSNNKKIYKSRVTITATEPDSHLTTENGIEVVEVAPEQRQQWQSHSQVGVVTVTGGRTNTTVLRSLGQDPVNVKIISPGPGSSDLADHDYRLTPPPDSPRNKTKSQSQSRNHNESKSVPNGIGIRASAKKQEEEAIEEDQDQDQDSVVKLPTTDRRESPEGQESLEESKRAEPNKHTMARYAPDGADKSEERDSVSGIKLCKPVAQSRARAQDSGTNEDKDDDDSSTDSWTEEISFTEENAPPPLDLTLHTIVEESCDEYEPDAAPAPAAPAAVTELERYYNFATEGVEPHSLPYEESEFSDTISESSYSSELRNHHDLDVDLDLDLDVDADLDVDGSSLLDLAAGRPEKYFMSFGQMHGQTQQQRLGDSDSVGSESDTDTSVSENRKKVLKHHRRSVEFEAATGDENGVSGSDEDDSHAAFEQEGFDTIKKQRKLRRSSEDLLDMIAKNELFTSTTKSNPPANSILTETKTDTESSRVAPSPSPSPTLSKENTISVSRSNSFTWSSDEEVNLMMSKLRQLVKNLVQNKKGASSNSANAEPKDEKLIYLESELIRLMRSDNIKSIVDHISSDSDDDMQRLIEKVDSGNQPELLNMVMKHIGQRLSVWMKDEDAELTDDAATIKCAASISSDLNEDRFSWKGSFESTLAKRQSVGSSDSLDCGGVNGLQLQLQEGSDVFANSERSILRSSSLHHLANSQPILEESDSLTNSLPRLNNLQAHAQTSNYNYNIGRARSLVIDHDQSPSPSHGVKSARYRPPGYSGESEHQQRIQNHVSTPTLLKTEPLQLLHQFDGFDSAGVDSATMAMAASVGTSEPRGSITIRGQIEFSMQYDYKHSSFEIKVKQCRDLAAVDTKRGRSDPYVKVYLLPERTKSSKRKTKIKRNTLNPVFGEVLKFPISLEELETRNLWVSVWHSDLFGKNEFLGQIVLDLKSTTFDDTSYQWYTLGDKDSIEDTLSDKDVQGVELVLALKWSPRAFARGDLSVLVKEAKGLKCVKNATFPSTFVKCVPLADKSKKQKTSMCRKSLHPSWNQTLTFDNISNMGIELSLYNYDLLNHELLHQTRLDSSNELWADALRRDRFWVEGLVTFNE